MLLITGVAFFALVLGSGPLTPALASIGLTPLMAAVLARPPREPPSRNSLPVHLCVRAVLPDQQYTGLCSFIFMSWYELVRALFLSRVQVLRGARQHAGGYRVGRCPPGGRGPPAR